MVNVQRPGGLARWENALLWTFVTVILASVPISAIAFFAEYYATDAGARHLAHLVLIADALAIAIMASLTFWMIIFRHFPRAMNPWRICVATVAFAYLLGSTYELIASQLIGHPLPTLEQLAPGAMAFVPAFTWMIAIILFGWGLLVAFGVRRAMQADARQRQLPTPPPAAQWGARDG